MKMCDLNDYNEICPGKYGTTKNLHEANRLIFNKTQRSFDSAFSFPSIQGLKTLPFGNSYTKKQTKKQTTKTKTYTKTGGDSPPPRPKILDQIEKL